jgi:hypothetical protein
MAARVTISGHPYNSGSTPDTGLRRIDDERQVPIPEKD